METLFYSLACIALLLHITDKVIEMITDVSYLRSAFKRRKEDKRINKK